MSISLALLNVVNAVIDVIVLQLDTIEWDKQANNCPCFCRRKLKNPLCSTFVSKSEGFSTRSVVTSALKLNSYSG
jgi:hypothetical protein